MNQREIKFRAWDKKEKKMLYSPELSNDLDGAKRWFALLEDESYTASSQDMILQQYTGLKDKNGKEVYEGDIIRLPEWYDEDGEKQAERFNWEVTWNGVGFSLFREDKDEEDCWEIGINNITEFGGEVIGNIYE